MAKQTGLFDRMFPGAQTPNNQRPQYSAPSYSQGYDPNAPGYTNLHDIYQPGLDAYQAKRQQGMDQETSDYTSRLNALRQAFGMGGGSGGSGGGSIFGGSSGGGTIMGAPMNYTEAEPTRVPGVEAPDMTDANAQIFGRAKDQAGQVGRSSLQSMRDELGATGMLGSGAEVQGTRDIASKGMGLIGEVSRDNAINESSQKADFAKMKYQGDITQRGQDIAAQEARARIALQRELAQQQMLQAALQGLMGGSGGRTSGGGSTGGSSGGGPARGAGAVVY